MVGFAARLVVRRKRLKPGTWRSMSSVRNAAVVSQIFGGKNRDTGRAFNHPHAGAIGGDRNLLGLPTPAAARSEAGRRQPSNPYCRPENRGRKLCTTPDSADTAENTKPPRSSVVCVVVCAEEGRAAGEDYFGAHDGGASLIGHRAGNLARRGILSEQREGQRQDEARDQKAEECPRWTSEIRMKI